MLLLGCWRSQFLIALINNVTIRPVLAMAIWKSRLFHDLFQRFVRLPKCLGLYGMGCIFFEMYSSNQNKVFSLYSTLEVEFTNLYAIANHHPPFLLMHWQLSNRPWSHLSQVSTVELCRPTTSMQLFAKDHWSTKYFYITEYIQSVYSISSTPAFSQMRCAVSGTVRQGTPGN